MPSQVPLKEVIHYYQGQPFCVKEGGGVFCIDEIMFAFEMQDETVEVTGTDLECVNIADVIPILKDPALASEDELREYHKLCKVYKNHRFDTPDSVQWLIKNGFDAFDLIERGLAMPAYESLTIMRETDIFDDTNNPPF